MIPVHIDIHPIVIAGHYLVYHENGQSLAKYLLQTGVRMAANVIDTT